VGLGGRKDKCNNPGPQEEAKDNEHYHRASERDIGYEEVAGRVKSYADAEPGMTGPDGTSPRESNRDNHAVGGGKEEHGTNTGRVHSNHTRGGHNASTRGTNRKSHTDPSQRKGTYTQVPQPSRGC
jgi:hypothetical protein